MTFNGKEIASGQIAKINCPGSDLDQLPVQIISQRSSIEFVCKMETACGSMEKGRLIALPLDELILIEKSAEELAAQKIAAMPLDTLADFIKELQALPQNLPFCPRIRGRIANWSSAEVTEDRVFGKVVSINCNNDVF